MQYSTNIRDLLRHIKRAETFLRWVRREGDDLVASANLLGGSAWEKRAEEIVSAARAGYDLGSRRHQLHALRRLLLLDLVDDVTSLEAVRFARLHPDDPRADIARTCAEALDRGVRSLEALYVAGIHAVGGLHNA